MEVENKDINGKVIPWLSEEDYKKSLGQLRMQLSGVFEPFTAYGLDIYIPGAKEAVVKLCEDFALRCRGLDHPIDFQRVKEQTNFRGV